MLKGDEYSLQLQCPRLGSNSSIQSSSSFPLPFLKRIRKSDGVGGSYGRGRERGSVVHERTQI